MIINSLLENDLYKFSMGYFYQMKYPFAYGTFSFKDRNNTVYTSEFVELLKSEFKNLSKLFLQKNEFDWVVKNIPYIPSSYWEWLQGFRFDPTKIKVWLDDENHLHIEVTDRIYKVSLYEIPILAIVSELYYQYNGIKISDYYSQVIWPLNDKIKIAKDHNLFFSEFGMRRRFSSEVEDRVVKHLVDKCDTFVGTSTVYYAMKYGIKPIGTMAHELFMAIAAYTSPKEANFTVMDLWSDVFAGNLGTVLTDTFTVDAFLRGFSMKMAKLYDGVRHDSGDPFTFGDKIINKYKSYGIDPMSKFIIFSDALDFNKAAEIKEYFAGKIKVSFGIGTNLTNNIKGVKPMNIVMKLKSFQINENQPIYGCVKLSDVPTKAIGYDKDIESYKYQLGILTEINDFGISE